MAEAAIRARGLGKRYRVYDSQRARLLHALSPSWTHGMTEIWALQDVDLEVARGESLAIIGRNGGGKSTLLQLLTGTMVPTTGEVAVNGRVSALLELGSGFNPEYTGRDNVMMNGLILGLTREEIAGRFGEIAAFAEIGDAIDRPVKTYSSGMLMRLAFAVQVLTDPEILVIDEALSVGDFFFQQKCLGYIRALLDKGVTLVFVSHDMGTVRDLCRRAVYLRDGRVAFAGETSLAIHEYLAERGGAADTAFARAGEAADTAELDAIIRDGLWHAAAGRDGDGRIIAVAICDGQGKPATSFRMGESMRIRVAYRPALSGAHARDRGDPQQVRPGRDVHRLGAAERHAARAGRGAAGDLRDGARLAARGGQLFGDGGARAPDGPQPRPQPRFVGRDRADLDPLGLRAGERAVPGHVRAARLRDVQARRKQGALRRGGKHEP
jgi:lipopolysaccharide transport system ATP-binding protein